MTRLFEIRQCGDPYNRTGWDVYEHEANGDGKTCIYRGDLSPMQGRDRTVRYLRRAYPEAKVIVSR